MYGGQLCLIKSPFFSVTSARPPVKKRQSRRKYRFLKSAAADKLNRLQSSKLSRTCHGWPCSIPPIFALKLSRCGEYGGKSVKEPWKLTSFSKDFDFVYQSAMATAATGQEDTKLSAGFWPRQTSRYPSHPLKAFCTIQMPPKVTQGVWFCWAFLMPRRSFLSDFLIRRFFRRRRRRFKGQQFSHLPQIPRNLSQLLLPA